MYDRGVDAQLLTAELAAPHARNKLSARQVIALIEPGLHGDGGGLNLGIRPNGRSWIFIGTLKLSGLRKIKDAGSCERIELDLGSALDVSLAKASERSGEIRDMLLDGIDPCAGRLKSKQVEAETTNKPPAVTFGGFALEWLDSIEDGFKNLDSMVSSRGSVTGHCS